MKRFLPVVGGGGGYEGGPSPPCSVLTVEGAAGVYSVTGVA